MYEKKVSVNLSKKTIDFFDRYSEFSYLDISNNQRKFESREDFMNFWLCVAEQIPAGPMYVIFNLYNPRQ